MDIRLCFCDFFLVTFLLCVHGGLIIDDDYEDGPTSSFGRCPWIRNKLKNGRVKYRYRGRVAKFICDAGFELAGKRSSTCVRGQWTNPVPVCVARGCVPLTPIPNGRVTEMYRGALLVYDCNPGYILEGETSIHCNGRRWNTSPPICGVATESPETQCDFESTDLCGWTHDPTHEFDWQRNQFSTPSGHVGTGPSFDHTFGENKGGYYLYLEASSPRKVNDTARLFSPVYPEDLSGGCFVFWYHMYGATTGGLRVYLKPESYVFDEVKPTWAKNGDQGNHWLQGKVIVPVVHENFQIVIEGVRGESYVGDSAIDDVWLARTTCETIDNSTNTTENTARDSCRGRCREKESTEACGCNDSCYAEGTCCNDYFAICNAGNDTLIQNTDEPLPGDFFAKTSSLVTASLPTTEKSTEEQITTVVPTESTELDNSTKKITVPAVNESLPDKHSTSVEISNFTTLSTMQSVNSSYEVSSSSKQPTTFSLMDANTTVRVTSATSTESTAQFKISSTSDSSPIASSTMIFRKPSTNTLIMTKSGITTSTVTTPSTTEFVTGTSKSTIVPTSTPLSSPTDFSTSKNTIISTTSTIPYSTKQESTLDSTTNKTTEVLQSSSIPIVTSTISTRRTYNLRPRTQVTTPSSTSLRTVSTTSLPSTTERATGTDDPLKNITSTTFKTNIPSSTTAAVSVSPSTPSTLKTDAPYSSTTASRFIYSTASKVRTIPPYSTTSARRFFPWSLTTSKPATEMTTKGSIIRKFTSSVRYVPKTTTPGIPQTTKFAYRITTSTESPLTTTSDFYESGASKSKTSANSGSGTIIIALVVVLIICVFAGLIYYMKKRWNIRQSKLSDDSEMRFLPESDYNDYSDVSALERIFK